MLRGLKYPKRHLEGSGLHTRIHVEGSGLQGKPDAGLGSTPEKNTWRALGLLERKTRGLGTQCKAGGSSWGALKATPAPCRVCTHPGGLSSLGTPGVGLRLQGSQQSQKQRNPDESRGEAAASALLLASPRFGSISLSIGSYKGVGEWSHRGRTGSWGTSQQLLPSAVFLLHLR